MLKQLVFSPADLRFVSIACQNCRTEVVLDLTEDFSGQRERPSFAPRTCPSCRRQYDSAIAPAIDELYRAWRALSATGADVVFRARGVLDEVAGDGAPEDKQE